MENLKITRDGKEIVLTDEEELAAYYHFMCKDGQDRLEEYIELAKGQGKEPYINLAKEIMEDPKKCLCFEQYMRDETEETIDGDYYCFLDTIERKMNLLKGEELNGK